MSQEDREIKATLTNLRVYEYTGTDGATYYSFTRKATKQSPPVRLTLKSKLGVHFLTFLAKFRQTARALGEDDG